MAHRIKRTPENGRTLSYIDYVCGRFDPSSDSFAVTYYETVRPVLSALHVKTPEQLRIKHPEGISAEEERTLFFRNWTQQATGHIDGAINDLRTQLAYVMTCKVAETGGVIDCWPEQLIPILRFEDYENVRTDDKELNERAHAWIRDFLADHAYFSFFNSDASSWRAPAWKASESLPTMQEEKRIDQIGTEIRNARGGFLGMLPILLFSLLLMVPGALGVNTYLNGTGLLEHVLMDGPDLVQAFADSMPYHTGIIVNLLSFLPMLLLFVPLYLMLLVAQVNVTAASALGAAVGLVGVVMLLRMLLAHVKLAFRRASLRFERRRLRNDREVRRIRKQREVLDAWYPVWTRAWLNKIGQR